LVLEAQALVLVVLHDLDGDLEARDLVVAKVNGVAGTFADDLLDFVLFELVAETLGIQDGKKELSAIRTRL